MFTDTPSLRRAAALAALLTLAACSPQPEEAPAATSSAPAPAAAAPAPAPAPAPEAPEAPEAADAGDKIQTYVQCYNRLDGKAHRTLSRYASWVKDMRAGPTGKERVVYGLYAIGSDDVAECRQTMAAAAAQKPALAELDAAATAYIGALQALDQTVSEIYLYYDRENYKDDNFAKGKQLHPTLVGQGQAFGQASEAFSRALDEANDKLLAEELARVEQAEGRKLTYWRMSLMAQAKQLVNLVGEEQFPPEAAATRLAAFESTADEALRYSTANKGELPTTWTLFESAVENYRKAAKQRVRRVRDKVPYNQGEKMMLEANSAWMVEGSQGQLIKAYNDLIESSNRLH